MWLRPVSLDKIIHKDISPKLCFTPEINSKHLGTGECVGIGPTTVTVMVLSLKRFNAVINCVINENT